MNDITNIRLSKKANEVADKLVSTGKFEDVKTVAKFALAYAIKNHFDEFDPKTYVITDSDGSNYNVGSFDNDGRLSALIRAIYPDVDTPYIYARELMIFGLLKIGELIDKEGIPTVYEMCS